MGAMHTHWYADAEEIDFIQYNEFILVENSSKDLNVWEVSLTNLHLLMIRFFACPGSPPAVAGAMHTHWYGDAEEIDSIQYNEFILIAYG